MVKKTVERPVVEYERIERKVCWNAAELLEADFPDLFWYIDQILSPGLTLFWGPAKAGKSIFITQALLSISSGKKLMGYFKTEKAQTLYISLEDNERRVQRRLVAAGAEPQTDFLLYTDWPRGSKGIHALENFLNDNSEIKVVCLDTLVLFSQVSDFNDYAKMSNFMSDLKRIADQREICIIAIHHSKKTGNNITGDITESALGSTGIVAGPDHLLFLERTPSGPSDAILHYISKDAEPARISLQFNETYSGWAYGGDADVIAKTNERQEILDLLKEQGPMQTAEIEKALGSKKSKQAYSNLLSRLTDEGLIIKLSRGIYDIAKRISGEEDNSVVNLEDEYIDDEIPLF